MGEASAIQWTESTWNPWHGCIKVSQGCKNCYMYRDKERYGQDPRVVVRSKTTFNDPLKWKDGRMIFTCSWSDFFIEEADDWRDEAWDIIRRTPHHTYQILTKRPGRIKDHLPTDWGNGYPNVWLGVSVEDQLTADERIPLLLKAPAVLRWLSAEPLLGPLEIATRWLVPQSVLDFHKQWSKDHPHAAEHCPPHLRPRRRLDWIVIGGESGPDARPMHPDWAKSLRDQCVKFETPFFFKQWGEYQEGSRAGHELQSMIMLRDGRVFNNTPTAVPGLDSYEWAKLDPQVMTRVGKKLAGRLLDGREWNEYPKMKEVAA